MMASLITFICDVLTCTFKCCEVCFKCYKLTQDEEDNKSTNSKESVKSDTSKPKPKTKKYKKCSGTSAELQPIHIEVNPTICPTMNPTFAINHPPLAPYPNTAENAEQNTPAAPGIPGEGVIEWVPSTVEEAGRLVERAVVGGYDIDDSDLWVIRSRFKCEVIPGKLNKEHNLAFAVHETNEGYKERNVTSIEVCCAPSDRIKWISCSNGEVPKNAIPAGRRLGETLYVGRVFHQDKVYADRRSLCPGFIQPTHGVLYVTYHYSCHAHKFYEVMCFV